MAQSEILQLKEDESPLFSPENPKDLFRNFKKIGEGGVGTVYLAYSRLGEKVQEQTKHIDRFLIKEKRWL